jgi:stage II sporulation protein D
MMLSTARQAWIALLFWLVTFGGCKARQLARTTPQMDIEPQFWIRVLLLDDARACLLKASSSFAVLEPQTKTAVAYFDRLTVPAIVEVFGGRIVIAGQPFTGSELIILPEEPHIFNLDGNDYRGKLKLILNPDGNSFDAINLVPLEPYLAGVVGAEMPDYWEPAALEAQAIAARTYCLYIKKRFGRNRNWDLTKTQANQVYLGVKAESSQVWDAVYKTYGQALVCNQTDGSEGLFPAYYSSTCGGHTENSEYVFGDSFPTLVGVTCPYCKDVAKPNFFFWPMAQFDKVSVTAKLLQRYPKLKQLSEIINIVPAKQSNYGEFSRLTLVKLLGSTDKSDFLRAEDLRLAIDPTGHNLKSTICQIVNMGDKWAFLSGRGYGHGVGMCQCGAQALARGGKTAKQILLYYYPSSRIVGVY